MPGPTIIRSSLRLATLRRQAEEASKTHDQSKEAEPEMENVEPEEEYTEEELRPRMDGVHDSMESIGSYCSSDSEGFIEAVQKDYKAEPAGTRVYQNTNDYLVSAYTAAKASASAAHASDSTVNDASSSHIKKKNKFHKLVEIAGKVKKKASKAKLARSEARRLGLKEGKKNQPASMVADPTSGPIRLDELRSGQQKRQPSPSDSQQAPAHYTRFSVEQVKKGFKVVDDDEEMLVHVFEADAIPREYVGTLDKSFQTLFRRTSHHKFNMKANSARGGFLVRHLGCWNAPGKFERPYMTALYRGSERWYKKMTNPVHRASKSFLRQNQPLFGRIKNLLENNYKEIHDMYDAVQVPKGCRKAAPPFCMVALNKDAVTKRHRDLGDTPEGICAVFAWGDFEEGGDVVIDELEMVIPLQPGQLIFFRSFLLTHWNLPVPKGSTRNSFVLFTDKEMHNWEERSKRQVLNRIRKERHPGETTGVKKKRKRTASKENNPEQMKVGKKKKTKKTIK
ncbi:hypothetical protein BJ508DRAFT_329155 [Ascobolus immersus RN42]|uniref:Uncharacterized protein n=1 Tax=Ascobolus immersus RN42 TaxID=1160509 RepID=A0A3N4I2S1_ASCIM|nr:hypothetical protein BJ508DRAFT_329155 [Ascobolus immersus RN42]